MREWRRHYYFEAKSSAAAFESLRSPAPSLKSCENNLSPRETRNGDAAARDGNTGIAILKAGKIRQKHPSRYSEGGRDIEASGE